MKSIIKSFYVFLFISFRCLAQSSGEDKFSPAIEDNSMFIEEAYNQEKGVVQHISNFIFFPNLKDNFLYSFTQEWPAFGLKHQLSYTIQYASLNRGEATGFGDILLNYRYQLSYKENFLVCAPRISIVIPTGNSRNNLGVGSWGLQANLPFSKRWSDHFVNHLNLGATYLFDVKGPENNFNKPLVSYSVGISSIWLATSGFNLMLEIQNIILSSPGTEKKVIYENETIIAPAVRFAIDVKNLQIVPGLSVPFSSGEDNVWRTGAFVYLSLEHPF